MKRTYRFLLLFGLFIVLIQPNGVSAQASHVDDQSLHDTLITLLDPYIANEIEHYYGYHKSYGLYDAKILELSRNEGNEYRFNVKIQVNTFEEAHNPPYGKETIILDVGVDKVTVNEFIHEGDEWEKKITIFYDEVIADIVQAFSLDLHSFKEFNYDQLMFASENMEAYTSLSEIVTDVIDNQLVPEMNTPYTPYKNVIHPVTFIKDDRGYILFKHADGTNVVLEVAKTNDVWDVVYEESKEGEQMENELLWYM